MTAIHQTAVIALTRGQVLRRAVAPTASAFVVFVLIFVWFARRARPAPASTRAPTATLPPVKRVRSLAGTVLSGYAFFALIIGIFYFVLADEPRNFIPQSLAQGAALAFGIVLPAFVILSAAERAVRRSLRGRRRRRARGPQQSA